VNIAHDIESLRVSLKLTQQQMADKLGISQAVYNQIKVGRTKKYIRALKINEACTQYSYKHTGVIRLYYATGHNIHAVSQHCRHYSIVVTQNYLKSLGFVDNSAVRNAVF